MLKQFFWMCSGADTDILKNSSKAEQTKFAGIGGTVFFTAVMAFIAASYALYTVFDSYVTAIVFGLVWGLLIFNLDRFIVSTIKKQDNKWKEIWQAAPRIILAIIIAVVISKPLEMKLFEKEINQVLLTQKNELTLANKTQIANQFTPEIEKFQNEINHYNEQFDPYERVKKFAVMKEPWSIDGGELTATLNETMAVVEEKDAELNKAWFVFGTTKELKEQGDVSTVNEIFFES